MDSSADMNKVAIIHPAIGEKKEDKVQLASHGLVVNNIAYSVLDMNLSIDTHMT